MIERLGLTRRQRRQIEAYALLEPIGEGMVDYNAKDKAAPAAAPVQRQSPDEIRRSLIAASTGAKEK